MLGMTSDQIYKIGSITIEDKVHDLMSNGTLVYNEDIVGYVVSDVNGGYNIYNDAGVYTYNMSPNGSTTSFDGTTQTWNAAPVILPVNDYMGSVATSNPDGTTSTVHLGSNGQVFSNSNEVIGTFRQTDTNDYEIYNLEGGLDGSLNTQNGSYTKLDGDVVSAGYKPTGYNIPTIAPRTLSQTQTQGLDYNNEYVQALAPQLAEQAAGLSERIDEGVEQAQDYYQNQMNRAMGPQAFQGTLNTLAGRNVLDSSVAEGALMQTQQQTAQAIADKAYQAALAGTQLQMDVPGKVGGVLGQLGGQTTEVTQTTEDPLEPYRLSSNLLK